MYKPSYFEHRVRQLSLESCWSPCFINEEAGQQKCSAFCPVLLLSSGKKDFHFLPLVKNIKARVTTLSKQTNKHKQTNTS